MAQDSAINMLSGDADAAAYKPVQPDCIGTTGVGSFKNINTWASPEILTNLLRDVDYACFFYKNFSDNSNL